MKPIFELVTNGKCLLPSYTWTLIDAGRRGRLISHAAKNLQSSYEYLVPSWLPTETVPSQQPGSRSCLGFLARFGDHIRAARQQHLPSLRLVFESPVNPPYQPERSRPIMSLATITLSGPLITHANGTVSPGLPTNDVKKEGEKTIGRKTWPLDLYSDWNIRSPNPTGIRQ